MAQLGAGAGAQLGAGAGAQLARASQLQPQPRPRPQPQGKPKLSLRPARRGSGCVVGVLHAAALRRALRSARAPARARPSCPSCPGQPAPAPLRAAGCLFESLLSSYDLRGRVRQFIFFVMFMVV